METTDIEACNARAYREIDRLTDEIERLRDIITWCRRRLSSRIMEPYLDRMLAGDLAGSEVMSDSRNTTIQIGARVRVRPTNPPNASWSERIGEVVEIVIPGMCPRLTVEGGPGPSPVTRYVVKASGCKNVLRRADEMEVVRNG
jgi:hypothetical protein